MGTLRETFHEMIPVLYCSKISYHLFLVLQEPAKDIFLSKLQVSLQENDFLRHMYVNERHSRKLMFSGPLFFHVVC